MVANAKNKCTFVTLSIGLFLICRGEKCVQYCTIIDSVQCSHAGILNTKNPLLWVVAIGARCEPYSTLDHVEN
jgi:hypothetical protein